MHSFHSAHIFILCNMYVIYNQVNVPALFDIYHIVLNCTVHLCDAKWSLFVLVFCGFIVYIIIIIFSVLINQVNL